MSARSKESLSSSFEVRPSRIERTGAKLINPVARRNPNLHVGIKRFALLLVLLALAEPLFGQQRTLIVPIRSTADSLIVLPDNFPDYGSLSLHLDSSLSLVPGRDFRIDTNVRTLRILPSLFALLYGAGQQGVHTATVAYYPIEVDLKRNYSRHALELTDLPDSLRNILDTTHHLLGRIASAAPSVQREDLFSNFQKSGSISRGFQAGSNRDLSLTSGFNLQFSGDLAMDVNVTGALTEETTPIQPEGNTQTIHDIDRVFIKVKAGEHFSATLGDFFLDLNSPTDPSREYQAISPLGVSIGRDDPFRTFNQSTFDVVSRKLLGAEAVAQFKSGSVVVSGASTRGKYATNVFQGQEAFQGPYRLTGTNGERAIIIIAGTERVYVDGALQTRGERNDYVIDYALGEIRFQPRRLVTSESRITVDFEYSDQQYSRSLLAANGRIHLIGGDGLTLSATYLREGDNQDAPLDLSLSDSDRSILANAGSNPFASSRTAIVNAGRDAQGRALGSYAKVDTIVGGSPAVFYRYAPQDTLAALYNISFGSVGPGRGAYQRLSIGQFEYVGAGRGDYDTINLLPLPQLKQIYAFSGNARISQSLGVTGEFATSVFTSNRFADRLNQQGNAYRFGALFADTIPLAGYLELKASQKRTASEFVPIDRIQDVEFQRRYGNDASREAAPPIASSEILQEATILYRPFRALTIDGSFGELSHPELAYRSRRLYGHLEMLDDSTEIPHTSLSLERMPTEDSATHEQALWNRLYAETSKRIRLGASSFTLGARLGEERKTATPFASPLSPDTLLATSFGSLSYGPSIALQLGNVVSLGGEYNYRRDDSARSSQLTPISTANTGKLTIGIQNLGGFSTLIDLTVRNKHFSDSTASLRGGGDEATLLLRLEPHYTLSTRGVRIDALYEISNQRAARLERVFFPVQKGLGSYYYIGDLNGNHRADPEEFAPARYSDQGDFILISIPTEQLYPSTDLRSNLQLHLSPRDLLGLTSSTGWLSEALGNIGSESYLKLEETSTDENPSDIYFFRLSHFRNDTTTLHGLLEFEQDLNILENDPAKSFRLHYLERSNASQFNTGLEHTYLAERTFRARVRPMADLAGETTLASVTDAADADTLSVTRPHSTSIIGMTTDWSYHPPASLLDYGLRVEVSHAREDRAQPGLTALSNAITARSSYAVQSRARIRAEFERDELTLSEPAEQIFDLPYALTGGRALGATWLWKLALDYQFGAGIVATISYDGRNSAGSSLNDSGQRVTVHNARAEVRANF